jgi:hypothetical protein
MAKNMMICGRYGNSCGTPFIKNEFIKKHRQYEMFAPYLKDRPSEEWTDLSMVKSPTDAKNTENKQEGGKLLRVIKMKLHSRKKYKNKGLKRSIKYRGN